MFASSVSGDERLRAWGYVAVQLLLLVLLAVLPPGDAWTVPDGLRGVGQVARLAGIGLIVVGLVSLGRSASPFPAPSELAELRTGGVYALVRHPIYSGLILLGGVWAATSGSWLTVAVAVALAALLARKARWEERRLRVHFPGYAAYAARVGRFVPLVGRTRP